MILYGVIVAALGIALLDGNGMATVTFAAAARCNWVNDWLAAFAYPIILFHF